MRLVSAGHEDAAATSAAWRARVDLAAAHRLAQHQYAASPAYQGKPPCEHHFAALKRLLDRREPDHSD